MFRIPFDPSKSADQTFQVLIPERMVMTLRMVWNTRSSMWGVTITTDRGTIGALNLVEKFPILYSHKALSPIDGDIVALPLSNSKGKDLTEYDAIGDSWGLFWVSPEEIEEWEEAHDLG